MKDSQMLNKLIAFAVIAVIAAALAYAQKKKAETMADSGSRSGPSQWVLSGRAAAMKDRV